MNEGIQGLAFSFYLWICNQHKIRPPFLCQGRRGHVRWVVQSDQGILHDISYLKPDAKNLKELFSTNIRTCS